MSNFRREIYAARVEAAGPGLLRFEVHGQAFLWHMVRCLVAIIELVGDGLEAPDVVDALLDVARSPRRPQYGGRRGASGAPRLRLRHGAAGADARGPAAAPRAPDARAPRRARGARAHGEPAREARRVQRAGGGGGRGAGGQAAAAGPPRTSGRARRTGRCSRARAARPRGEGRGRAREPDDARSSSARVARWENRGGFHAEKRQL